MKISELIEKLQKIKNKKGNLEVYLNPIDEGIIDTINKVKYSSTLEGVELQ